jgi:putative ABC transport system substrate-binding protein
MIGRRKFITLLGGAAATWPLAARAQQQPIPVIGYLGSRSAGESADTVAGFRQGLKEAGYVEGQNAHIAFRWADNHYDRLPALAAELVQIRVAVIVAAGGVISAQAAKAATATIPIVGYAGDPVRSGLVSSLNRPGGNITGVSPLNALLEGKRLGLLHDLVPTAAVIAALVDPDYPDAGFQLNDTQDAARALGKRILVINASSEREIDAAFASLSQQQAGALLVTADPFFTGQRAQLVALAARHALPTMYNQRAFAAAGGLVSYGPDFGDANRQVGIYTGRILKGAKPADLPFVQATRFELVINLKTAKALGLTVPSGVLAIADEAIE